jgi:hypothetical protein
VWFDVGLWHLGERGVQICEWFANKLWGWEEWVLCSLWLKLLLILRLALTYILIRCTDICLELSLTIILVKHDTTLDHVITRPLIWTVRAAVVLWICIHWVPAETLDILKVLVLSLGSADKFQVSGTIRAIVSRCKVFRIPLCQPTDHSSVVGQHRGEIGKEKRLNERKEERKENVSFNSVC